MTFCLQQYLTGFFAMEKGGKKDIPHHNYQTVYCEISFQFHHTQNQICQCLEVKKHNIISIVNRLTTTELF